MMLSVVDCAKRVFSDLKRQSNKRQKVKQNNRTLA
jgi:hypothetical protein